MNFTFSGSRVMGLYRWFSLARGFGGQLRDHLVEDVVLVDTTTPRRQPVQPEMLE